MSPSREKGPEREPGRRIVSVWFPHLAIERWRRAASLEHTQPGPEIPVALSRPGPHGPVIHAASEAALALGIAPGARVVDAQAMHPGLHVEPGEPEGDVALLGRLALWSRRWCPWTAREGEGADGVEPDGIVMDATGSAHLFGGEAAMLDDVVRRFAAQGADRARGHGPDARRGPRPSPATRRTAREPRSKIPRKRRLGPGGSPQVRGTR